MLSTNTTDVISHLEVVLLPPSDPFKLLAQKVLQALSSEHHHFDLDLLGHGHVMTSDLPYDMH